MFRKRLKSLLVIILGLLLVIGLTRNVIRLVNSGQRIEEKKNEVRDLRVEQERLAKEWEESRTEEFVEEMARDKLNMAREGEVIAVLPQGVEQVLGESDWEYTTQKANWKLWWEVFEGG